MGSDFCGNDVLVYTYIRKITPLIQSYVIEAMRACYSQEWWNEVVNQESNSHKRKQMKRADTLTKRRRWMDVPRCCTLMLSNKKAFNDPVDLDGELLPLVDYKYTHWLKDSRNYDSHLGVPLDDEETLHILYNLYLFADQLGSELADDIYNTYRDFKDGCRPQLTLTDRKKKRRNLLPDINDDNDILSMSREDFERQLEAARLRGMEEAMKNMASNDHIRDSGSLPEKAESGSIKPLCSSGSDFEINEKPDQDQNKQSKNISEKRTEICCKSIDSDSYIQWDGPIVSKSRKSTIRIYDSSINSSNTFNDDLPEPVYSSGRKKRNIDELSEPVYSSGRKKRNNDDFAETFYNDAVYYYENPETDPDFELMLDSFDRSARLNYGPAQFALACAYCLGLWKGKTFRDAYCMFALADSNGMEDAKYYIEALKKMGYECTFDSEIYQYYLNNYSNDFEDDSEW